MIDFEKLNTAYLNDSFYSLQLEVGDKCFQDCVYCYMNALQETRNELDDDIIINVLYQAKELGITAIEWLGGEPLLRNSIFKLMEQSQKLGFRNNMWTGGLPFADKKILHKLIDLCHYGLISFHLSTIEPHLYKTLHPKRTPEDIQIIINGVKYFISNGYPNQQMINSVTFTGMQSAEDMINTINYFYNEFGILTSINVYHTYLRPDNPKEALLQFIPAQKEVSKVYNFYKKITRAKNLPMNCVNKQYCSATLALLNNGYVTPCATIREHNENMNIKNNSFLNIVRSHNDYLCFKHFKNTENLPDGCKICKLNDQCWGCRSRSYAIGNGIYGKDPRCFRQKKSAGANSSPEESQDCNS